MLESAVVESPLPQTGRLQERDEELRQIVSRHKVYWQAWPELMMCGTERRQVGFRLALFGTHDRPEAHPVAGCSECWRVYKDLHELARALFPEEERESAYHIGIFDASLVFSGSRRDVLLTIKISHRHAFDRPVDACELRCLAEMQEKLLSLGSPRDKWSDTPTPSRRYES